MNKKYLLVSLEDARTKKLADVLSNKTCKRIIDVLSEKEATKTEISKILKAPLNTIEYNVNKLVDAGLIEKSKNYFWSAKGKKIEIYKISNKSIVISPKTSSKLKTLLAALGISGLATAFISLMKLSPQPLYAEREVTEQAGKGMLKAVPEVLTDISSATTPFYLQPWFWFLVGALFALVIFIILNWKKW
ncbi:MAG: helix-turn-helix domain-containing protein [Candidatus Pacearchaeota archaeon]|nr:helix-turn-helix domain-containing protein [Candidatus Pacearchaeota archaeon]